MLHFSVWLLLSPSHPSVLTFAFSCNLLYKKNKLKEWTNNTLLLYISFLARRCKKNSYVSVNPFLWLIRMSSRVICWFSCKIVYTILTFWSLTILSRQPGLGASSADKGPFLKSRCHLKILGSPNICHCKLL